MASLSFEIDDLWRRILACRFEVFAAAQLVRCEDLIYVRRGRPGRIESSSFHRCYGRQVLTGNALAPSQRSKGIETMLRCVKMFFVAMQ